MANMTHFLDKDSFFFFSWLFRNRRSGQNDRLSGVSVALHYGSESEDDAVLSGQYELLKVKRNSPRVVSERVDVFRLCLLRRGRVRSWESEFQYGDEQPNLPVIWSCERRQEQPGPSLLWTVPAAAVSQGVPWLLPADQTANRSAADQVRSHLKKTFHIDWVHMGLNSTNETVKKCVPFFVRAKMKNGEYENVEQMEYDLNTMFENAKRYNMPNSSIYKRAFRLQQIMQVNRHLSNLCVVLLLTL